VSLLQCEMHKLVPAPTAQHGLRVWLCWACRCCLQGTRMCGMLMPNACPPCCGRVCCVLLHQLRLDASCDAPLGPGDCGDEGVLQ
jgi:hypothetical protein